MGEVTDADDIKYRSENVRQTVVLLAFSLCSNKAISFSELIYLATQEKQRFIGN